MVTLVERCPLESTKPLKKTLSGILLYVFILIIGSFMFAVTKESAPEVGSVLLISGIIIVVAIIVIKYIYEVFYLKYYFYDYTDKYLIIRKGVFSRNEINLPFNRLQDIYIDQDILDRIFGLFDVHVSSATATSGFLSHIDGLNKENSEIIKQILLKKVHRKR